VSCDPLALAENHKSGQKDIQPKVAEDQDDDHQLRAPISDAKSGERCRVPSGKWQVPNASGRPTHSATRSADEMSTMPTSLSATSLGSESPKLTPTMPQFA